MSIDHRIFHNSLFIVFLLLLLISLSGCGAPALRLCGVEPTKMIREETMAFGQQDVGQQIEIIEDTGIMKISDNLVNPSAAKLIMTGDNIPTILFFDDHNNLIVNEIHDHDVIRTRKIKVSVPGIWNPQNVNIFTRHNKIYLVYTELDESKKTKWVNILKFYVLDKDSSELQLNRTVIIPSEYTSPLNRHCEVTRIYPLNEEDGYFMTGSYITFYFIPFPRLSLACTKTFSLNLVGDELSTAQLITGQDGKHSVSLYSCAIATPGIVHCAWRQENSCVCMTKEHEESVWYRYYEHGQGWSSPIELDKLTYDKSPAIQGVSIAGNTKKAYILWDEEDARIYFTEIENDTIVGKTELFEKERYISPQLSHNIAANKLGHIVALWKYHSYKSWQDEIALRCRVSNRWTAPYIIRSGFRIRSTPDVTMDESGKIHLAYVKGEPGKRYRCYYQRFSMKPLTKKLIKNQDRNQ